MRATASYPTLQVRRYLPKNFKVSTWEKLQPLLEELTNRTISNTRELERWILDRNEVEAATIEEFGWRYIHLTRNASDEVAAKEYEAFVKNISPKVSTYDHQLNLKLIHSPFLSDLEKPAYAIYLRGVRNAVELHNENNITLSTAINMKSKEYGKVFADMLVEIDGEHLTLQQTHTILEATNRQKREQAYRASYKRMRKDASKIDAIFDTLLEKRHLIAQNSGFDNYRDYKFKALGRFDYTATDCFDFHDSIKEEILPIVYQLQERRKAALGVEQLRPWDLSVDISGRAPLQPFDNTDDLVHKSAKTLSALEPFFGECLSIMRRMGHLDLETREGKRPGGYNMPLVVTGVPFIFMNAANSISDMRTLMHESGHAVHSFLTRDYRIVAYKRPPSEVAELAAMTMELLTLDYWKNFFEQREDLKRAKIWLLENILQLLPWIATIDKFQHWLYTNPEHTPSERVAAWLRISHEFTAENMKKDDLRECTEYAWHRQLHIFEVPFYYIEYGMAQLGAIAIWKRYCEIGRKAVEDYSGALKLGYSRPIKEIYQTAGIEFNFSREYVRGLAKFLQEELLKLYED
ncbi:MAG: M3 family oligoendopeptidase [Bacteroidota bacterium]